MGQANPCDVANSYSDSTVSQESGGADIGGLIGVANPGTIIAGSFAAGALSTAISKPGGFVCADQTSSGISDSYWDTTTTGVDTATCTGSDSGVTPLTTSQLQSKLPAGFSPTVWVQNPSINNGFPYLIANPPPK